MNKQDIISALELTIERLELNNCEGEEDEYIEAIEAVLKGLKS